MIKKAWGLIKKAWGWIEKAWGWSKKAWSRVKKVEEGLSNLTTSMSLIMNKLGIESQTHKKKKFYQFFDTIIEFLKIFFVFFLHIFIL